ncbi:MAG: chemotaxis response regulator protein-glutamate methylesterase [Acidobacteria bacterium]|nr:chemotaxis response regulator protein-glutamate methylesterase [Acidobacteriota bacterium]
MRKIRILIVDDAVVIRRLLTDELSKDAHLEVVGAAANGRIALAKIPQLNPDLVTLDIEMPEMNGLEALAVIRKQYPFLPVIMFSTLTERGASETLEALSLGASDYVTKPANVGSVTLAMKHIHQELVPKIKAFCGKAAGINLSLAAPKPSAAIPLPQPRARVKPPSQVEVVAIGVSTGGPNALAAIFPTFPADLPVPIVIVQHMPPVFTKILAERLEQCSSLRVREAQPGDTLQPGCAWLAPGGYHMIVERHGTSVQLQTHQGPPENSCRPAVDVLFRSVADVYGRETLAVVLTGMGQDGLRGCEPIHEAGGQILAQDEESSVVWGMPGFVANSGLADKVIPQDHIGVEITRRVMQGRLARVGVLEARGEG